MTYFWQNPSGKKRRTTKTDTQLYHEGQLSYPEWESSIAASYGGVFQDWPPWAKKIVRGHYGYLPPP